MKILVLAACVAIAASPASAQTDDGHVYAGIVSGIASTSPNYEQVGDPAMNIDPTLSAPTVGAVAGIDFKIRGITVGAEGDIALLDKKIPHDPAGANWYTSIQTKWTAHIRARLGFNAGPSTKVFAAGGIAYLKLITDDNDPDWGIVETTHTGWSVGTGVEHRIARKVWLRGEYIHDQFNAQTGNIDYRGAPIYDFRTRPNTDSFRVGVLYRF